MYKFNGGDGAVICDKCRVMIDSGLSYKEYEECYGIQKRDLCPACQAKHGGKDVQRARKGKMQEA